MPRFDVGIEGVFRVDNIEAVSGEEARNALLKRIKDACNGGTKFTRTWFQPSSEKSAPAPAVENS